ncbi:chemotaxis protein CheD [Halobacillus karajensis]|uniref:Probable chemoreceptor glutamine deamidase CheD n=1 Tax=Halobacillus karajensis TaxID=195088 RepID=A0A024P1Z7_9BACI|nr:chemotaxis protein CheD [Halobacillus karajensis]CDQ19720.1 Chemoreceptor glutamine deamidase CheD [Halobacillus karajensis]CDQ22180.1 Chemoreceptor glutamine deamidase CheD [Halobacillus karajensis]CDQ28021.1 Chemoreceptor glutamine deamidase CheD [Halobacillus karajensis]SEH73296.1 chemotaxis protein CheD [Halobacillus karajensis]
MSIPLHVIKVGIGDMGMVHSPDTIRTSGLGSCVGIVLYDEGRKTAGMAHIMLPEAKLAMKEGLNRAKYADTAIDDLIVALKGAGSSPHRLKAKLAGGAQMFQFSSSHDMMRIGPRNIEAVKENLSLYRIPVIAEDVGGNSGRTIEFDPNTSALHIRTVNLGKCVI